MSFWAAFTGMFAAIVRDRAAFSALIGAVLIYSFFYPAAYHHETPTDIAIIAVDQDHSALSRRLLRAADATQGARVIGEESGLAQAQARLANREAEAILWIAPGLERDALRGAQGEVALFASGANLTAARGSLQALAAAVGDAGAAAVRLQSTSQALPAAPRVSLILRPLFNTREGYGSAVVPAVVAVILQQTLLLGIGIVIATWRAANPGPVDSGAFFGAAAAFAAISTAAILYFSGFVAWVQDYPRGARLEALLVVAPLFAIAATMFGLFLASFFDRRERAGQVMLALGMPFFFLSGFSWPLASMPAPLALLAQFIPSTPGLHALVEINQMGASLWETRRELGVLALHALGYGTAAWLRARSFRAAQGRV